MSETKNEELEFSDACGELAEIIQTASYYTTDDYALMLMMFYDQLEQGESNRMALAIAKKAIGLPK